MTRERQRRREDKFISFSKRVRINPITKCWDWIGAIANETGYGYLKCGSMTHGNMQNWLAHRFSYMMFKSYPVNGMEIDHLCKNRRCVNPEHLEEVDQKTNNLRSDSLSALNFRKTHCKNGHPFDDFFTYNRPDGNGKDCKICRRKRSLDYYYSNKEINELT